MTTKDDKYPGLRQPGNIAFTHAGIKRHRWNWQSEPVPSFSRQRDESRPSPCAGTIWNCYPCVGLREGMWEGVCFAQNICLWAHVTNLMFWDFLSMIYRIVLHFSNEVSFLSKSKHDKISSLTPCTHPTPAYNDSEHVSMINSHSPLLEVLLLALTFASQFPPICPLLLLKRKWCRCRCGFRRSHPGRELEDVGDITWKESWSVIGYKSPRKLKMKQRETGV